MFIFLCVFSAICDVCQFDPKSFYPARKVVDCLQSPDYNPNDPEHTELIPKLQKYIDNYVLLPHHRSPPTPHENLYIDLVKDLNTIKPADYTNVLDFHLEISMLEKTMRDPHTLFYPPCTTKFRYLLPYAFNAQKKAGGNSLSITAIESPYPSMTTYHEEQSHVIKLRGKTVLRINPEGEDEAGLIPSDVAISDFAEKHICHSKYPAARLNRALQTDFSVRNAALFRYPTTSGILVEYDDAGVNKTIILPWYGATTSETAFNKYDDLCPPTNRTTVQEEETEEEVIRWLKSLEAVPGEMTKTSQEADEQLKHINAEREGMGLQTMGRPKDENQAKNDEPGIKLLSSRAEVEVYYIRHIRSGLLKIKSFAPKSEETVDFGKVVGDGLRTLVEDMKAERLIIDVRGNGGGIVLLGMQLNEFLYPSMFPSYATYDMKKTDIHRELVKVPDEDGEIHFIEPKTREQFQDDIYYTSKNETLTFTDVKTQEHHDALYTRKFEMRMHDPPVLKETMKRWKDYPGREMKPLFEPSNIILVTDGLCGSTCSCFIKHQQEEHVARIVGLGGNPHVDKGTEPELFDSGTFAGGTVFSYSGIQRILANPEQSKLVDASKFPAKFARATTEQRWTMHGIHEWSKKTPKNEKKMMTAEMDGADETGESLLEFKVNPVDFVHSWYPNEVYDKSSDGLLAMADAVSPYFDKCADWEVKVDPACKTPAGNEYANKLYGRPCIKGTGKYNESECVFSRCEYGYYLDGAFGDVNAKCVKTPRPPIPEYEPDTPPVDEKTKLIYKIVIMSMFGGFLIALCVIVAIILIKKKKQAFSKVDDNDPLLADDTNVGFQNKEQM